MVNQTKKAGLGRTLQKVQRITNRQKNPRRQKDTDKHTLDDSVGQANNRPDLKSVIAQTNLDEFLEEAQLAGKQFITERRNVVMISEAEPTHEPAPSASCIREQEEEFDGHLTVPRRPHWDSETTPEQLDEMEKKSFLSWRKKLAHIQENENLTLTPFEKNLEVWRQLWRVVERSDMVVQILDARNPLLYLCDDLIKYVQEDFKGQKLSLVLLNKADFLTPEQRRMWLSYFEERNIKIIFFSALFEDINQKDIYNKHELIDAWRDIWKQTGLPSVATEGHLTVGLVGYPNVGKSSTINALLSAKRVAVSATPGKTKHFQTFFIDRDIMLCDCPGLVFPNFVSSKSEMVTNGILPIDQMKDCLGPVRQIVDRIPRGFLEDIYGLAFEKDAKQNIIAEDLLNAFGFMRGYMTARGLPDVSRAARKICKDFINGKILFCNPPPNTNPQKYHECSKLAEAMKRIEAKMADPEYALRITERQRRLMRQAKGTDISSGDFDAQYFRERSGGIHIKGLPNIGNMTQPVGQISGAEATATTVASQMDRKHKKREKLRRVYRHMDE